MDNIKFRKESVNFINETNEVATVDVYNQTDFLMIKVAWSEIINKKKSSAYRPAAGDTQLYKACIEVNGHSVWVQDLVDKYQWIKIELDSDPHGISRLPRVTHGTDPAHGLPAPLSTIYGKAGKT